MIEGSLLSAIAGSMLAGLLDEKSERSEESDGRDVWAGFRRLQELCIFIEESGCGFVTALAEEVGFADSLVGQGSVEGEGGGRQENDGHEGGDKRAGRGALHGGPPARGLDG